MIDLRQSISILRQSLITGGFLVAVKNLLFLATLADFAENLAKNLIIRETDLQRLKCVNSAAILCQIRDIIRILDMTCG